MNEVLVIDIGGTKINTALVVGSESGIKIISSEKFLTPSNPEHAIQKIESFVSGNQNISSMSLSLPGLWDENGILRETYFLDAWLNYPFIKNLAMSLGIKHFVWESDVISAAMGEYYSLQKSQSPQIMLYINIGTGIGAALIREGKPYKSKSNLTLRMQKLVFPLEEEIYSAVDLICGGTLREISGYESIYALYDAYRLGDIEAIDIISKAQFQLGAWLINMFYLFAPDIVVIGGGLTNDWEILAEGAVDVASEELGDSVQIIPSTLNDLAPIYGAYLNLKSKGVYSS